MKRAANSRTLDALVARVSATFERRYGNSPRWIVAAPGRVNVIGEHIDYIDGFVLPMAIERYCVIAAGDTSSRATSAHDADATVFAAAASEETVINLRRPQRHANAGHWSNYMAGVIAEFGDRGVTVPAFQAVVDTDVPIGGGLSSSASLEVATATLVEAMTGAALELSDKALLCQKAEHEFAGVPCGIMDQFASTMGRADHLMLLDCRSQKIEHIPLLDPAITVLIVNTNVKHELSGGEYAQRRAQCESAAHKLGVSSLRDAAFPQLKARGGQLEETEFRRARHAITEIARTVKAAQAVKAGQWAEVGQLMYASHASLRDDYDVSCRELDLLVEIARELGPSGGVIGSRMTGGGFGGCTVSLVETERVSEATSRMCERYQAATGIEASALTSRPARGAHIVQNENGA